MDLDVLRTLPKAHEVTTLAQAREVIALQGQVIDALVQELNRLRVCVEQLESQLSKNSRNSSCPPSSDGYRKPPPKSRRKKSSRSSGGQRGHKGNTLKQVAHPDTLEEHPLEVCPGCGHSLRGCDSQGCESRQVFELPPLRMHVTEHRSPIKRCPGCGETVKAVFPTGVNQPVQYGERVEAAVVYLSQYQLLPYRRLSELLGDLFGLPISQGTIDNMLSRCTGRLASFEERIKALLIQSPVVHADETGMRVNKALHWLHVCGSEQLTYYHLDAKRGGRALQAMGILDGFTGTAIHDHWRPYYHYDCRHALCNAHHLRELIHTHEQYGQRWAEQLIACLLQAKAEVERAIGRGRTALPASRLTYYQRRYSRLLRNGRAELPTVAETDIKRRGRRKQHAAKNLHDRLVAHKSEVLAFVCDFAVPFDNNQAERDLRMGKVKQKISGCFRSARGAHRFARIRGYISTVKKNSMPVFESLISAIQGRPFIPQTS